MQGITVERYAIEVLARVSRMLAGKGYGPDKARPMLAKLSAPAGRGMIEGGYDDGLEVEEVAGRLMAGLLKG